MDRHEDRRGHRTPEQGPGNEWNSPVKRTRNAPVVSTGVEGPDWLLDKLPRCWGAIEGPDKEKQMRSGLRRSIAFNLLPLDDFWLRTRTAFCEDWEL